MDIKRMNSASKETHPNSKASKNKQNQTGQKGEEVKELKEELNTLKDRIMEMTSNIDTLTSLVQTVTLKEQTHSGASIGSVAQEQDLEHDHDCNGNGKGKGGSMKQEEIGDQVDDSKPVGAKRKKVSLDQGQGVDDIDMNMEVDQVMSSASPEPMNVASSALPLQDVTFTPTTIFPVEPVLSQETEGPASEADEAFVDELFNAFDDEMDMMVPLAISTDSNHAVDIDIGNDNTAQTTIRSAVTPSKDEEYSISTTNSRTTPIAIAATANTPDQEMMNKLSEALTVLPKDIQEMLVNRLISTITSTDSLKAHMDSVCAEKKEKMISFPLSTCTLSTVQAAEAAAKLIKTDGWEHNSDVVLQTASATLTALMTQFSKNMEKKAVVNTKTLPVISIHA